MSPHAADRRGSFAVVRSPEMLRPGWSPSLRMTVMLAMISAVRRKVGAAIWAWPVVAIVVVATCGARWGPAGAVWSGSLLVTFSAGAVAGVLSAISVGSPIDGGGTDASAGESGGGDAMQSHIPTSDESSRATDLRGACLDGARLKGADLRGADLRGASLVNSDLSGANLEGANLGQSLLGVEVQGSEGA